MQGVCQFYYVAESLVDWGFSAADGDLHSANSLTK